VRVLALSWTPLWPLHGGGAVRAHALLSRLVDDDVRVVAPGPMPPSFEGHALSRAPCPTGWANPDVLHLVSPGAKRVARRVAREHRPQVVIAFGVWSMGMAGGLGPGAPCVLDMSHVESLTAAESGRRRILVLVLRWLERRAMVSAEQVWTVSEEDRQRAAGLLPGIDPKVRVVRNGMDPALPSPPPTGSPFRVLFVGRLAFRPNRQAAEFLIREIIPRVPEAVLTVVGGHLPATTERVDPVGACDQVASHYARAHAVCAPVFAGTGSRLKVLEAAVHGRPLVATRRAVEGHGFVAGRHYLEAGTAEEFVEALRRLHQDPELAATLATTARAHVLTHHQWDDAARGARHALEELVAKCPGGDGLHR